MRALKTSMRWDEEKYGREYDLDVFNIAAVSDFNMGAMENKGLNVFNTKYVLARPETATDFDYQGIETVIAHEYFHNWTGNRITCRDWFQLSLKEGLTVFRDQEFTADQGSRAVKRLADVRRLRAAQFPEDDGPLAHPVRPDSYIAIDNFYTATVYQKGAEVVRMMHTEAGAAAFRRGMDCYFDRHDNQAVTIEDFVAALSDGSGVDLTPFLAWYGQAGTPEITVSDRFDAAAGRYTLTLRQQTRPTPGQPGKVPVPVPVAMALLAPDGRELPGTARVLLLREAEQDFVFEGLAAPPVPSLLRGFSAPVRLAGIGRERLRFLAAHDTDPFVRWDSLQTYATGADARHGRALGRHRTAARSRAAGGAHRDPRRRPTPTLPSPPRRWCCPRNPTSPTRCRSPRRMRSMRCGRRCARRSGPRSPPRCARPTRGSPIPARIASTAPRWAGGRCATSASPISRRGSPRRCASPACSSTRRPT